MRLNRLVLAEALRGLGVPGMVGIGLALLALALAGFALLPARAQLERERQDLVNLQEQQKRIDAGLEKRPQTPKEQLDTFYALFPQQTKAAESLEKIYAAAESKGVTLPRGEYALTVEPRTNLAQYRIVLPVAGSYEQIRGFIAQALQAVPTLALDRVELQREKIGDTQLEAKINMTLFLAREG